MSLTENGSTVALCGQNIAKFLRIKMVSICYFMYKGLQILAYESLNLEVVSYL